MSDFEKAKLDFDLGNAYKRKDKDEVQRLVDTFVDNKYSHNMRIYHGIEYEDEEDVVSLLSDANTDFNWTNETFGDGSFMHQAAFYNKLKVLDVILKSGGDSNIEDIANCTPLHYCQSPQAAQLLLDHGANIEHTDTYGNTPTHMAVYRDREEVLHTLITYGSNLDTRNNDGETALDIAKRINFHNCVKILEDAMKKKDEVDKHDDVRSKAKTEEAVPDISFSPEVQASLIDALQEGSGDANVCLILMHGAPAAGKSSVNRILQRLPPLPKPQQHSTAMFEDPVRLIKTDRFSLKSKGVHVLKHVDEMKIMKMIASHVREKEEKHISEKQPQPSTKSKNRDKFVETQPPTATEQPVSNETSSAKKHPTSQPMSDILIGIAKLKKDGKSSSDLFNIDWFHIVDSGGQPQFTDVLPLMFPKVSLHLVVIRLDEKLDDKPKVRYLVAGENTYELPENLALSNLQIIERTCELAEATRISSEDGFCPWVMVIATHLDCECPEESLKEKNRRLQYLVDKYDCILIPKSGDEVIFAMNAMAPEGQERDEYTRLLQQHILQAPKVHSKDVQVPARWMLFHLELSRCSDKGVVEKSVCLEVGDRIQMHEDDVMNAVEYFDSVALLMYLPNKLPDVIFTKFDPVVSRLSEVLAASFTRPSAGPMGEDRRKLRTTGILRKKFVEELFHGKFNPHPFSVDMFFALLEYLRISDQIDKDTYFIPCVLPLDDPNPVKFVTECSPVLLTWCENVLPQGFFPALIVQLLRRKSTPCFDRSIGDKQLRRAVYLDSQYGPLLVVDQISWFELYFSGKKTKFPIILEAVEESSRDLAHIMKLRGYGELKRAFRCPSIQCKTGFTHPGVIIPESNMAKCSRKSSYRFPLSPEEKLWIKSSSCSFPDVQQGSKTPSKQSEDSSDIKDMDILSRRPELAELENHVRTNKWHAVGLQLHLEENDLVAIERECRGEIASCRRSMFHLWLKSFPEASRKQLLDCLKSKAVAEIHMAEQYRDCICQQLSQKPTPTTIVEPLRQRKQTRNTENDTPPLKEHSNHDAIHQTEINNSVSQTIETDCEDVQFPQANSKMDTEFSMKRRCDDITGSHKRRKEEQYNMPVCVGQKRHHQDSYDSQVGSKKPALQADSYGQSKPGTSSDFQSQHDTPLEKSDTILTPQKVKDILRVLTPDMLRLLASSENRIILASELYGEFLITEDAYLRTTDDAPISDLRKGVKLYNDITTTVADNPDKLLKLLAVLQRLENFETIAEKVKKHMEL